MDSRFEVERRDNVLVVTAPVDSSFNPDRPGMLLPVTLGPITRVAKLVEKDEKTAVVILGHADSTGADDVNRTISRERASAVAAIFRLSGFKHDRLRIRGLGSDMPRAANDSKEGRAMNRRGDGAGAAGHDAGTYRQVRAAGRACDPGSPGRGRQVGAGSSSTATGPHAGLFSLWLVALSQGVTGKRG